MSERTIEQIQAELQDFFPQDVVGWKPQSTSGNRALAVAYIDARDVENRLDAVVGINAWQDAYQVLPDGNVVCTLSLRINGEWIGKTDVGGESDQKDDGDRKKAAFSDAFKRAAVKWGIGRYLYSMPTQWVDFDPQKKQFTRPPVVPQAFLPRRQQQTAKVAAATQPPEQPAPQKPANGQAKPAPTGAEFQQKIYDLDAKWAKEGRCKEADLVKYLSDAAALVGYRLPFETWDADQVKAARQWCIDFEAKHPVPADPRDDLIRQIHAKLQWERRTWEGSLLGAKVPDIDFEGFEEPQTPAEALRYVKTMAVTVEHLRSILATFQPAGKPAKAKKSA